LLITVNNRLKVEIEIIHNLSCHHIVMCLSVSLSQVGVVLKWLNVESHKQRHTIAQGL